MMIGHVTVAGLAEFVVSAGVVAFLQRADPMLLAPAAGLGGGVPARLNGAEPATGRESAGAVHALWAGLGVLMVLAPLGILAAGTAWGEWAASDFENAATRVDIAEASLGVPPPAAAPAGLERLSSVWTAPWPDYAPPFVRSASFGYVLSAVFGVGLVILASLLILRLLGMRAGGEAPAH
jgi:cobalt/nickel transport system permease protein